MLIQHITLTGKNNVDGDLGTVEFFEEVGRIKARTDFLTVLDIWAYTGDAQKKRGEPQITEEKIVMVGKVTAYVLDDPLEATLQGWTPLLLPFSDTTFGSGSFKASLQAPAGQVFDIEAGERQVTTEFRNGRNHFSLKLE